MDLLPEELRKALPPLYSQESSGSPKAYAKFFTPDARWTWLVTEGSEGGRRLAPVRICHRAGVGVGVFFAV